MFEYQRLMKDFDGDMMNIVLEPQLKSGDKELENPHIKSKETFILRSVQMEIRAYAESAIPIFGCVSVFCFDQFTNHNTMAADALIAVRINLSPGRAQPKMRDGWYINENGEKLVHSM
ncbi:hypothetical protein RhiirC2_769729, partial [Rhizophagus irregularis]